MSDLDVRRLVRDFLRTGLNVEETLDLVLRELVESSDPTRAVVKSTKTTSVDYGLAHSPEGHVFYARAPRTAAVYTIEVLTLAPVLASDPLPPKIVPGANADYDGDEDA